MSVVRLNTGKEPSSVNERLVEMLCMLMEKAKSGEMIAMAYAATASDGTSSFGIQDAEGSSVLAKPIMALHYDYSRWVAGAG